MKLTFVITKASVQLADFVTSERMSFSSSAVRAVENFEQRYISKKATISLQRNNENKVNTRCKLGSPRQS